MYAITPVNELRHYRSDPEEALMSLDKLKALFPGAREDVLAVIADSRDLFEHYKVNTDARMRMFLAQMSHESNKFKSLKEKRYRNTTFEEKYGHNSRVGRVLGNTQPGDGEKYFGRGIIQLTGRWNYEYYGGLAGVDLINNPDAACEPEVALKVSLAYWDKKRLNEAADKEDVKLATKRINGGYNGLKDRESRYERLRNVRFDDVVN